MGINNQPLDRYSFYLSMGLQHRPDPSNHLRDNWDCPQGEQLESYYRYLVGDNFSNRSDLCRNESVHVNLNQIWNEYDMHRTSICF